MPSHSLLHNGQLHQGLDCLHPQDVHVLLVDDEQLSRLVVGNLLRKCDYKGEDETRRRHACATGPLLIMGDVSGKILQQHTRRSRRVVCGGGAHVCTTAVVVEVSSRCGSIRHPAASCRPLEHFTSN